MSVELEGIESTRKRLRGDILNLLEVLEITSLTPYEVNKMDDIISKLSSSIEDMRIEVERVWGKDITGKGNWEK
jgi:hypothetical protein